MQTTALIAGATAGVSLVVVVQNAWLHRMYRDPGSATRGVYAAIVGITTTAAFVFLVTDGAVRDLALDVRNVGSILAGAAILDVLSLSTDRVRPRWLTRLMWLAATAGIVLVAAGRMGTVLPDGSVAYPAAYWTIAAVIVALMSIWAATVVRHARARLDRILLGMAIGAPVLLFAGFVLLPTRRLESFWLVILAPLLLAAEVVRWANARDGVRAMQANRVVRASLTRELARTHEQLRAALREHNELIDAASHELRTPLTAILGFAETLDRQWSQIAADQRTHYLGLVADNAARLHSIVDELMVAGAVRNESIVARRDRVALRTLLEATTRSSGAAADAISIACDPAMTVLADPAHVPQILDAIIMNATQHGAPPLTITATCVADAVEVAFHDEGPGVAPSVRGIVFHAFTQASRGAKRATGGVGLGLHNAEALARLNGGELRLDHSATGATFVLRLDGGLTIDVASTDVAVHGH